MWLAPTLDFCIVQKDQLNLLLLHLTTTIRNPRYVAHDTELWQSQQLRNISNQMTQSHSATHLQEAH